MIRTMLIVVILIGAMTGCSLPDNADAARAASPMTYVTPNDPPVLTLHGTADTIVPHDQAVRLDRALTQAGVPSYFISVTGASHGGFPDEAIDKVRDFFSKILLGNDVEISTGTLNKPESD